MKLKQANSKREWTTFRTGQYNNIVNACGEIKNVAHAAEVLGAILIAHKLHAIAEHVAINARQLHDLDLAHRALTGKPKK